MNGQRFPDIWENPATEKEEEKRRWKRVEDKKEMRKKRKERGETPE